MKTILKFFMLSFILMPFACSQYDDSQLWDKVNSIDKRVTSLESLVEKMNTNIASLQTIVTKLQTAVTISNVKETSTGYIITFSDGDAINLYHGEKGEKGDTGNNGKDGEDGKDGINGTNGKDGVDGKDAPVIGIDSVDGVYYWTMTINGKTSWLTDDSGNKIPLTGPKGDKGDSVQGEKGETGDPAPAPMMKIDDEGYWLISHDSGNTYRHILDENGDRISALGYQGEKGDKGDKGEKGDKGDAFFQSLVEGDDFVYLTLANGKVITIPKYRGFAIDFSHQGVLTCGPDESIDVEYTLTYGNDATKVLAYADNGWKAAVTRMSNSNGKITITAPSVNSTSEIIVLASDGLGQSTMSAIVCELTESGNLLTVAESVYSVPAAGSMVGIEVQTGIDYSVSVPAEDMSWISVREIVTKAQIRNDVIMVEIDRNDSPYDRKSTLTILNTSEEEVAKVVIHQQKGITENMIVYTSDDGKILSPYNSNAFGSGLRILSNNYYGNYGVITFSGDVTRIGDNAFSNCSRLRTIILPENVETIGVSAFYGCAALEDIQFNEKVTSFGAYSFNGCSMLQDVAVPDSVVEIGEYAFAATGLKTLTIGKGVKEIKYSSFENLTTLRSVIFSEGLESIGDNAFSGCSSLRSLVIPDSVKSVGYSVFTGCTNLNSITIGSGVENISESMFVGLKNLKNVTFKEGLKTIGDNAFDGCTALATISIPNSVTTIGNHAFRKCSSAASLKLGSGLTVIKEYAFDGCSLLKTFDFPAKISYIGDSAFNGCKGLTELIIPESTQYIGNRSFYGCSGIINIVINNGAIGEYAFVGCSALMTLTISKGSIGEYAFQDIKTLKKVSMGGETLGKGVSSIGKYAFSGCTGLLEIIIPESVTDMSHGVFNGCSALREAVVGNNVKFIGDNAFQGCSSLKSVSLGNRISSIGNSAFKGCYLNSLVIPESVKYIYIYAFSNAGVDDGGRVAPILYFRSLTPPQFDLNSPVSYSNKIYVPSQSVSLYKEAGYNAPGWYTYVGSSRVIEGYDFE